MLADALVERYSRQILLPDVGGRGQERLCATPVTVTGRGTAAAFAARLLAAAGLHVVADDGEAAVLDATVRDVEAATFDVIVGDAAVVRTRAGVVATLVGGPCAACAGEAVWSAPPGSGATDTDAAAAQAIGAVVAAEAMRVALGLARAGRVHTVDVGRGTFAARELAAVARCAACPDPP
jgi:hypothetical protein